MKTKIKYSQIMASVMLVGAPLLWSACTDTWDDHYGNRSAGESSLLENLSNDPDLSNFYRVIKSIGGDETLNSPQQLTVWAPTNDHFTSAQADSVISVYQKDVAAGIKLDDNKAITQFMQNHIALFSRPVSSLTNDTIRMLNDKYMNLVGTSNTSGSLNNNPFNDAVICNNGILYKTEHIQTFFPNVREYLEQTTGMDSIVSFITSFDEYELDEKSSVAGGIVDGKTVYLDSVTNLKNDLLSRYGLIQREDSTYTFIAPTNDVWNNLYNKYKGYYNYNPTVNNADSLSDVNTKLRIIEGRFFDTSEDWAYNRHPQDSLCNTQYSQRQSHNPRQNVYTNPESGILNGLQKVECSNGYVYVDNNTNGVIDPASTFFGRLDIDASSPRYYEIPKNTNNENTMTVATKTYEVYGDTTSTSPTKSYNYAEVTANVSTAHTQLEYTIPSTLSGCYYNIYIVTTPNTDNGLPCWFTISHQHLNEKGSYASATYFNNPNPVTEGSVDNSDIILKQSNYQRCFVTDPTRVDTILIQSAVQYTYSGYGLDDGVVKYTVSSFGPSSSREKKYTRTLRLNEIIMVPFATKEEAEAAAEDIDAFNDELLGAGKTTSNAIARRKANKKK